VKSECQFQGSRVQGSIYLSSMSSRFVLDFSQDNMVADALSRKNIILLTRLEVNVLGLDDIKKLYSPDPFLGPIFAKCSIHKG